MNIEKNDINTKKLNKKELLEQLAIDISSKFGIDNKKAESLVKKETLEGIDSLKAELTEQQDLSEKEIENLFLTLKGALEIIEKSSKIEIKSLKEDIEKSINIDDFSNNIEAYLPPTLVIKAKNPTNPHEHLLGFALGTTNSIYTTVDILLKIGKGIIQTPYHLYMIISGKAETDSFRNI